MVEKWCQIFSKPWISCYNGALACWKRVLLDLQFGFYQLQCVPNWKEKDTKGFVGQVFWSSKYHPSFENLFVIFDSKIIPSLMIYFCYVSWRNHNSRCPSFFSISICWNYICHFEDKVQHPISVATILSVDDHFNRPQCQPN